MGRSQRNYQHSKNEGKREIRNQSYKEDKESDDGNRREEKRNTTQVNHQTLAGAYT